MIDLLRMVSLALGVLYLGGVIRIGYLYFRRWRERPHAPRATAWLHVWLIAAASTLQTVYLMGDQLSRLNHGGATWRIWLALPSYVLGIIALRIMLTRQTAEGVDSRRYR